MLKHLIIILIFWIKKSLMVVNLEIKKNIFKEYKKKKYFFFFLINIKIFLIRIISKFYHKIDHYFLIVFQIF